MRERLRDCLAPCDPRSSAVVTRSSWADVMGLIASKPGTWFWLNDAQTGFSKDVRKQHPFVLPDGFDPSGRQAFGHGLPRSSQEPRSGSPGVDYLKHDPHGSCGGRQCDLDRTGWIAALRYQVTSKWISDGKYICVEPSLAVLGRTQTFDAEAARDA